MKNKLAILGLSLGAAVLSGCAVYGEPEQRTPPGQYERTSKSTDSQGTERETTTSTDVRYDKYGNKKVTIDKKTTTDPKGLFNKSTTQSHETND